MLTYIPKPVLLTGIILWEMFCFFGMVVVALALWLKEFAFVDAWGITVLTRVAILLFGLFFTNIAPWIIFVVVILPVPTVLLVVFTIPILTVYAIALLARFG